MPAEVRSAITRAAFPAVAAVLVAASPAFAADQFANVPLVTQDGKVVHFYDDLLKGKSVVVNLIYTHCTRSCPLETARLSQVQRLLGDRVGKDLFFYSITMDPARDTPEVLKAYSAKFHAGAGWLFLTGKKEDIKLISRQLGLTSLADASTPDGHMPTMMIGQEATGQWMRNSAVDNPRFLATTITHFLFGYGPAKPPSYADLGPIRNVSKGEYLFKSRCAACHTIGKGDAVGPDLAHVTETRERTWLRRYIAAPDRVLAAGDPIAKALFRKYRRVRMPNLSLSSQDVEDLLPYIEQGSKAAAASASRISASAR